MIISEFEGINSFLIGVSQYLLEHATPRIVRGSKTFEISHPVIFKINNPLARHITVAERNWNDILPYAESLWIASGRNDMALIGKYLKRLYDYSDDMVHMRAAYGPRLRYFNGSPTDYAKNTERSQLLSLKNETIEIDQFDFIQKAFERDPFTRQAIITITDPVKDYFQGDSGILKSTKDFPCTNNLHFVRKGDSLDLYVHMRSNDFFWGATGVNIFNFTFIQEYISKILGLKIGNYYHLVNNLHYYESFSEKVKILSEIKNYDDNYFEYQHSFYNLNTFDALVAQLEEYENSLIEKPQSKFESDDDFFNDWSKVLFSFHNKSTHVEFKSPVLQSLHNAKKKKLNV